MTKKFLKLFTIYGRGSRLIVHLACHNLGHATLDIYTNFRSQFRRRRLKFGFDWHLVSEIIFEKGGRMDGRRLDGCTISAL